MTAEIISTGAYVPEKTVTNDDLAKVMDTNDEWIRTRTGIGERHIADEEFPAEEKGFLLALGACRKAIENAEARPEGEKASFREKNDIDLVIVATSTPDFSFPATACRLQEALGLERAGAFDMSLACTGFIAALSVADAYIRAGVYKNILVVGVDVLSRLIDWSDRGTAVLFGDGAGAAILSASSGESGIIKTVLHSAGSGDKALYSKAMYFNEADKACMAMDGKRVYDFAVRKTPEVIREAAEAGKCEEIKYYILHQANIRIIEAVSKRLKEPMDKFPHNIERYGNTSGASIPIMLDELVREGKISRGDVLCFAGFGAGLAYGAVLLKY